MLHYQQLQIAVLSNMDTQSTVTEQHLAALSKPLPVAATSRRELYAWLCNHYRHNGWAAFVKRNRRRQVGWLFRHATGVDLIVPTTLDGYPIHE